MSLHRHSASYGTARTEEHKVQFRKHCHRLVEMGYQQIRAENHTTSDEDWITQRIVEATNAILRGPTRPRWAERYSLRDQVVLSEPGRVTRQRPKIDIEIESHTFHRPTYHFEAKRLRTERTDAASEYLGAGGVGSFLAEWYARSSDEAGMLGYVQSGDVGLWAQAFATRLCHTPSNPYALLPDGEWIADRMAIGLDKTFRTQHQRQTLGPLTLFHRLLDMRLPCDRHDPMP